MKRFILLITFVLFMLVNVSFAETNTDDNIRAMLRMIDHVTNCRSNHSSKTDILDYCYSIKNDEARYACIRMANDLDHKRNRIRHLDDEIKNRKRRCGDVRENGNIFDRIFRILNYD